MKCRCGKPIHKLRVKFLTEHNLPITCLEHSTVQKVAGYNLRSHKGTGDLVVTSQEEADLYYKMSARSNGIVASGVRFRRKSI